MPACAVYGCKHYSRITKGSNIKYYSFPKNVVVAKEWIWACRRQDKINLKHASVCSAHFTKEHYQIPLRQQLLNYTPVNCNNLKSDAVPTENLYESEEIGELEKSLRKNVKKLRVEKDQKGAGNKIKSSKAVIIKEEEIDIVMHEIKIEPLFIHSNYEIKVENDT